MSLFPKVADASDNDVLSIVLIGPDEQRRQTVAGVLAECMAASAGGPQRQALAAGMAIREFSSYSAGLDDLLQMLEQHCDVVMVDLDGDTEFALDVVERLSALDSATLMVYSTQTDRELVVRSMRAGAREFLTLPIVPADMDDALRPQSGIRPRQRNWQKAVCLSRRQRRLRCHHSRLQFCRVAGTGVRPNHPAD
jgi:pilus assembly protein CpaE